MRIGRFMSVCGRRDNECTRPSSFVLCTLPITKDKGRKTKDELARGFTILELMVVLTLILIIISIATPMYQTAIQRAREAVLRDNLYTMRNLIDQFTLDKQRPPQSLDELVDAGYLRGGVPEDPITRSRDTWRVDFEDVVVGTNQAIPGIVDVHSGSDEMASDGQSAYSSW